MQEAIGLVLAVVLGAAIGLERRIGGPGASI